MLKELAQRLEGVSDADFATFRPKEVAPNVNGAQAILMPFTDEWRRYYVAVQMAKARREQFGATEIHRVARLALLPVKPVFDMLTAESIPEGMTLDAIVEQLGTALKTIRENLAASNFATPDEGDTLLIQRFNADLRMVLSSHLRGNPAYAGLRLEDLEYGVFLASDDERDESDDWVVALKAPKQCDCLGCQMHRAEEGEGFDLPESVKEAIVKTTLDRLCAETGGTLATIETLSAIPDMPAEQVESLKQEILAGNAVIDLGEGKKPRFQIVETSFQQADPSSLEEMLRRGLHSKGRMPSEVFAAILSGMS